ncbi:unnamed protein product [Dovyalis caffra]|uniref:Cytochrome P450 n=1 Tax=Dovyalis caffra TaxID=77055 RepID=A0AAV1S6F5_9ROSI|nr:unnamed protein product [Dovyalis caffra]
MDIRSYPKLTICHFCSPPFLNASRVLTGNPANVQHMLKTQFYSYEKGSKARRTLCDFLGNGIFCIDGDSWKFQRQVPGHEFNANSLRKFVETVVETELSQRLIPILSTAAANNTVLDLQDVLKRFAFDSIWKIASGYDPAYLLPDLPEALVFNIGSEKRLKEASSESREFAKIIIKEKKQELSNKSSLKSIDLLSHGKVAMSDDVLPDETVVKKGMRVYYHPDAMRRLEMLWGSDWEKFRPERWLESASHGINNNGKRSFVGRDPYTDPVFQVGPRIYLGKDMAFLQMKRLVAGVLRRFKVFPAADDGVEPVFVS